MNIRGFTSRRAVVAMCGALMLLAVVPAIASASPEWYVNGSKVTTPQAIKETGTMTLKEPSFGLVITCSVSKTGTVGSAGSSEITKWTFSSCRSEGLYSCQTPELKAGSRSGSWALQLTAVGTEIHDLIGESQRSTITDKCVGSGILDECVYIPAEFLENNSNKTKVKGKYVEGKDEKFECTETQKGTAVLTGSEEIETTAVGTFLSVK